MKFLIVFAVAVGMTSGVPSGFLQNTAEVNAATQNFIREYNRLAKLAAEAPDIHIYHDDRNLQRIEHSLPARPTQHRVANPLAGHNFYEFTANLGGNNQFQPQQMKRVFSQPTTHHNPVVHFSQPTTHHNPVVHHFSQPQVRPQPQPTPQKKWTGPLAHSVPAGLNGAPAQVDFTPEVAAARNAHFSALLSAYQNAPRTHQRV